MAREENISKAERDPPQDDGMTPIIGLGSPKNV
jgi:hypothetical protein